MRRGGWLSLSRGEGALGKPSVWSLRATLLTTEDSYRHTTSVSHSLSRSHSHTLSHSLTLSHTHSLTLSLSHSPTLSCSVTLSLSYSLSLIRVFHEKGVTLLDLTVFFGVNHKLHFSFHNLEICLGETSVSYNRNFRLADQVPMDREVLGQPPARTASDPSCSRRAMFCEVPADTAILSSAISAAATGMSDLAAKGRPRESRATKPDGPTSRFHQKGLSHRRVNGTTRTRARHSQQAGNTRFDTKADIAFAFSDAYRSAGAVLSPPILEQEPTVVALGTSSVTEVTTFTRWASGILALSESSRTRRGFGNPFAQTPSQPRITFPHHSQPGPTPTRSDSKAMHGVCLGKVAITDKDEEQAESKRQLFSDRLRDFREESGARCCGMRNPLRAVRTL